MRLLFILSENPIYKPQFLEAIVRSRRSEVVGIVVTSFRPRKISLLKHLQRYFTLLGIKGTFFVGLMTVYSGFMNFLGRFISLSKCYSVKGVARRYGIPLYITRNVNDPRFLETVKSLEPDLIISSGNQIFGEKLLQIPRIGCINRHTSLLPKYKGIYPVFWAMLYGEDYIGVTLHWMTPEIDEGGAIKQEKIAIEGDDTFFSLYKKAFDVSARLVIEAIDEIAEGTDRVIETETHGSSFSYPTREDVKWFKRLGHRII